MDLQFAITAPNGDFTDLGLKILNGFIQKADKKTEKELLKKYYDKGIEKKPVQWFRNIFRMAIFDHIPKIHTIRKDSKKKWELGTEIRFIYKNEVAEFEFAPPAKVTRVQDITIKKTPERTTIIIDGNVLTDEQAHDLARNDGFLSVEKLAEFFFFGNEKTEYKGKLIHWTDDVIYYGTGDKE